MNQIDRFLGCLLGLATGDAVGTTVEFQPRGTFSPVTDMVGGGPFHLQSGEWTDDTSMALCLAASLAEIGKFDPRDQMDRYCAWMEDGYMSSNGRCFDIGITTSAALRSYLRTGDPFSGPTDSRSAGNGSIMRLAPVPMFFFGDLDAAIFHAGESSRTTHGAAECVDACRLFAAILFKALDGQTKEQILFGPHFSAGNTHQLMPEIRAIGEGAYRRKQEPNIIGSGYVVNSLEAALWSFLTTKDFSSAILTAVNLGDDADTTAAVCGQIAGAYYGVTGIPTSWLDRLAMRSEIEDLAGHLHAHDPSIPSCNPGS